MSFIDLQIRGVVPVDTAATGANDIEEGLENLYETYINTACVNQINTLGTFSHIQILSLLQSV